MKNIRKIIATLKHSGLNKEARKLGDIVLGQKVQDETLRGMVATVHFTMLEISGHVSKPREVLCLVLQLEEQIKELIAYSNANQELASDDRKIVGLLHGIFVKEMSKLDPVLTKIAKSFDKNHKEISNFLRNN